MHSIKPTPKMIEGLRWFAAKGPIAWFDGSAPSQVIRKRLQTVGWVEECGAVPLGGGTPFRVTQFQISENGRSILAQQSKEKA